MADRHIPRISRLDAAVSGVALRLDADVQPFGQSPIALTATTVASITSV